MANMTKADETVFKTDDLGRMQISAERRERLLDEFERSGLSGRKVVASARSKYQGFLNAAWGESHRTLQMETAS